MSIPPIKPALMDYLPYIHVVLCRPSHPANIGSAARAMKTMGLTQMTIVAPQLIATPMTPQPPVFQENQPFRLPEESFVLSSGAKDVLENARIVDTLKEALSDTVISCALTSRRREISVNPQTPRQLAPEILQMAHQKNHVALVFGNERFGLSIDEVMQCNRLMTINGNPDYFSLNLAQAVQVVSYEIFSHIDMPMTHLIQNHNPVPHAEIDGLIGHFAQIMQEVGFFERRNQERLMRRLSLLFERSGIEREEIDIMRGFLKTVGKRLEK